MNTQKKPSLKVWLALGAIVCGLTARAELIPVAENTYSTLAGKITGLTGKAASLAVTEGTPGRTAFLEFGLPPSLAGSNVTQARLWLYVTRATVPAELDVHLVTGPWQESVISEAAPSFSPVSLATIPASEVVAKQFIVVDVTSAVVQWLDGTTNNGLAITTAAGNVALGSKDGLGIGFPAMLEIDSADGAALTSLNGANIKPGSVGSNQLAPGSVTFPSILQGTITAADFASTVGVWTASGTNIFYTNGYVGIGTTNPASQLEVNGDVQADNRLLLRPGTTNYGIAYIPSGLPGVGSDGPFLYGYNGGALGGLNPTTFSLVWDYQGNVWVSNSLTTAALTVNNGASITGNAQFDGQIRLTSANGFSQSSAGQFNIDAANVPGGRFTVLTNGNVGIGAAAPGATLDVNGTVNVTGASRLSGVVGIGSQTGTSEAPNFPGLVIRRINSTIDTSNSIVALDPNFQLVRDGTPGGLILRLVDTGPIGGAILAATGVAVNGTSTNVYHNIYSGQTGAFQIFTAAQNIVQATISFGDTYFEGNMTEVHIARFQDTGGNNEVQWIGTVTSTFNQ